MAVQLDLNVNFTRLHFKKSKWFLWLFPGSEPLLPVSDFEWTHWNTEETAATGLHYYSVINKVTQVISTLWDLPDAAMLYLLCHPLPFDEFMGSLNLGEVVLIHDKRRMNHIRFWKYLDAHVVNWTLRFYWDLMRPFRNFFWKHVS